MMEEEEYIHPERRPSKFSRIAGKCISYFFIALVILVVVVILWRIQVMENVPDNMAALLVNDATYEAYCSQGENLEVYTQEKLDPVTTNKEAYGYFWVDQVLIIPEANQVQVLVKYNNSTLEHIAEDKELSEVPSREEDIIYVSLRVIEDATPENPDDIENESTWIQSRVEPSAAPVVGTKDVYNYRKYIFDDVVITEDTIGLKLDIYYADEVDYEAEPYGSLYVYYELAENTSVKLSKDDFAALREFGEQ